MNSNYDTDHFKSTDLASLVKNIHIYAYINSENAGDEETKTAILPPTMGLLFLRTLEVDRSASIWLRDMALMDREEKSNSRPSNTCRRAAP